MRGMLVRMGCVLVLGGAVLAQHEQKLAEALRAEEIDANPSAALKLYRDVAAAAKTSEKAWVDARLGSARCLRRLGRWAESESVLAELDKAPLEAAAKERVKQARAQLEGARQEQDEERIKLREEVRSLLQRNDVAALKSMGARAITPLLELFRENDPSIVSMVAEQARAILFQLTDPAVPGAVIQLVKEGRLPIHEATGVPALPRPNDTPLDWDPVIRAFLESDNPMVRWCGVSSFPTLRAPAPNLVRKALHDADKRVRLGLLRWMSEAPPWVTFELQREVLETLARDEQIEVRRQLASWLSIYSRRDLASAVDVGLVLTRDGSADVRTQAYNALAGPVPARDRRAILRQGLGDSHQPLRLQVASSFSRELDESDVAVLMPFLADTDRERRKTAAQLLARFDAAVLVKEPNHLPILWEAVGDSEETVRTIAARTLVLACPREDLPRLWTLLQSPSPYVRGAVLEGIIQRDAAEAIPHVLAALPMLDNVPGLRNGTQIDHERIVRWLIEKNHREGLRGLIPKIAELHMPPGRLVELLDPVLDATDKAQVLEIAATTPDTSRRVALLHAVQAWGAGNREYLNRCIRELEAADDRDVRAWLVDIVCNSGGASELPLVLSKVGGLPDNWAPFAARHSRPEDRQAIAVALQAVFNNQALSTGRAYADEVLPTATLTYLDALSKTPRVPLAPVYRELARRDDPEALRLIRGATKLDGDSKFETQSALLERLGEPWVDEVFQAIRREPKHSWLSRAWLSLGPSAERVSYGVSPYVAALYRARGAAFVADAKNLLASDSYGDQARASAVNLCAFMADGSGDALILDALVDASSAVRGAAVVTAAHLVLVDAIPRIRALLRDPLVSYEANRALLRYAELGIPIR